MSVIMNLRHQSIEATETQVLGMQLEIGKSELGQNLRACRDALQKSNINSFSMKQGMWDQVAELVRYTSIIPLPLP